MSLQPHYLHRWRLFAKRHTTSCCWLWDSFGVGENAQKSVPIIDVSDRVSNTSSNRAELLAAIEGVKFIAKWYDTSLACEGVELHTKKGEEWIITTDSHHVVKGMTAWLPKWKVNNVSHQYLNKQLTQIVYQNRNFKTSRGQPAETVDLFLQLDTLIEDEERSRKITIGF